jgi:hypothetical protein
MVTLVINPTLTPIVRAGRPTSHGPSWDGDDRVVGYFRGVVVRSWRPSPSASAANEFTAMSTGSVVVRVKFFRSFFLGGALANAAALFLFSPFVSFVVALLTLGVAATCIKCAKCGKSPYVLHQGSLRIGSPIPERKCSKCGYDAGSHEERVS